MRRPVIAVVGLVGLLAVAGAVAADTIAPVGMTTPLVGGSDKGLYTKGVLNGTGLNNIGLLIRVWGFVTAVDSANSRFYIDDGLGLNDYTTAYGTGVRVAYDGLAAGNTFTPPTVGQYVAITGISSCFLDAGTSHPMIRPRRQSDMNVVL